MANSCLATMWILGISLLVPASSYLLANSFLNRKYHSSIRNNFNSRLNAVTVIGGRQSESSSFYEGNIDLSKIDEDDDDLEFDEDSFEANQQSKKDYNDKEWMFFDVAKINVKGGEGGDGCMAMRREYLIEFGGPSGGNGGHGGSVYLECDKRLNTLSMLRRKVHHKAKDGTNGRGDSRHGYRGDDCIVPVPPGTVVRDQNGVLAGELNQHGQRLLVARGGKGGRGNESFKTARMNAPAFAERGEPGPERWLNIELKLIADVGLIGIPNAGKSTLLASSSNAKPKIADYPFTTVVPNLGVCDVDIDFKNGEVGNELVIADIPGLLEGAHEGIGLGLAFLRHIQRCRVLIHVIKGDSEDPIGDYMAINQELEFYNPELANKTQVVVINKIDIPEHAQNTPLSPQSSSSSDEIVDLVSFLLAAVFINSALTSGLVQFRPISSLEILVNSSIFSTNRSKAKKPPMVTRLRRKRNNHMWNREDAIIATRLVTLDEIAPNQTSSLEILVKSKLKSLTKQIKELSSHTRVMGISAVTGENVKELMRRVRKLVDKLPRRSEYDLFTMEEDRVSFEDEIDDKFDIFTDERYPGQFRVTGSRIEKVVTMTNWDYYESVQRFQRILEAEGITSALAEAGAKEGDLVMIGDWDFNYWERKNRWISELGLENINPRKRPSKSD
eukprot:gene6623-9091_t